MEPKNLRSFAPQETTDFFHNARAVLAIKAYFTVTLPSQALWVYGPPGCGKSTAVIVAAKECGVSIFTPESQEGLLLSQLGLDTTTTGMSKKTVVFRDGYNDLTTMAFDAVKEVSGHVIVLSHSRPGSRLKTIKGKAIQVVSFSRPSIDDVIAFLKRDVFSSTRPSNKELRCIVRSLHCDIRRIAHWVEFYRGTYGEVLSEIPSETFRCRRRRKKACGKTATNGLEDMVSRTESRSLFDATFPPGHPLGEWYACGYQLRS